MPEGTCEIGVGTSVLQTFCITLSSSSIQKNGLKNIETLKFSFISYLLSGKLSIKDDTVTSMYLSIHLFIIYLCRVYSYIIS